MDELRAPARGPSGTLWLGLTAVAASFLVIALRAATQTVADPDVWWVAAAGRLMRGFFDVPRENVFSATEAHHPWVMHEWGFAPAYALGLEQGGPQFFSWVALFAVTATCGLLGWATVGRTRSFRVGCLLWCLGTLLFLPRMTTARPTNVALLFALAMACVAFSERLTARHVVGALLIELLWANLHGSFPVGIALLAVAFLDLPGQRRLRGVALLGALVATILNPYGLKLHLLFWHYLVGGEGVFSLLHAYVSEYKPLWRARGFWTSGATLGLLWVLPVAVHALRTRRWRLRGAVCLGLVGLAVWSVRNLELSGLLCLALLTPCIDAWLMGEGTPTRRTWLRLAPVLAVLPGLVAGVVAHAVLVQRRAPLAWVDDALGGPDAASLAMHLPVGSRVFAPFTTSGMVVWFARAPTSTVFYDPRNDCYSEQTARDAMRLSLGLATPEEVRSVLHGAAMTHALLPEGDPVAQALDASPEWAVSERQGRWRLYRHL